MNNNDIFEYVGNLHIHSTFSDGTRSVGDIAQTASEVGLDFIVLNDHDYMVDELHLDEEGLYGQLMVFIGLEIGNLSHHYLTYNINEMVKAGDSSPQDIIDQVN